MNQHHDLELPPLRCTAISTRDAGGWRVVVGELVDNEPVFTEVPLLSFVCKVVHSLSCDDVVISPMVLDEHSQLGIELSAYLEARRYTSRGITARLIAPGHELD